MWRKAKRKIEALSNKGGLHEASHDPDFQKFIRKISESVDVEYYTEEQRHRDFVRVFNQPAGRRVLQQIAMWGGLYEPSPDEVNDMLKAAGARDLVLHIMVALHADPNSISSDEVNNDVSED